MPKEFDKMNIFSTGRNRKYKTKGTYDESGNIIEINFIERDAAYKYFNEIHVNHHEVTSLLLSKGDETETDVSHNCKTLFITDRTKKVMLIK